MSKDKISSRPLLSVVSPVYKAAPIIDDLVREISRNVEQVTDNYEIVLVEDHSLDGSWASIQRNCEKDQRVKGVKLSRNFGQQYAINAGLHTAKGEWVVIMDCDLQDRPEEIKRLYEKALTGYEIVIARRTGRTDGFFKKMSSFLFNKVFGYLTNTKLDHTTANFGLYHRKVVEAVLSLGDYTRYFPTMVQWVGFRKTMLDVRHGERADGDSSYSWGKLLALALDTIIAFSDRPLRLTTQFGLFISSISALIGVFYLVIYLLGIVNVAGFTSIIISLWFLAGIIIFTLGVIGMYLAKLFDQAKGRPNFIIEATINIPEDHEQIE